MPKSNDVTEVVDDSEEEQPQSQKKKNVEDVTDKDKDETNDKSAPEDDDEGDEEEYEIEAILDAKHGTFPGGRIGYLVKWKGYENEHNSWVNQDDAGNAQLLIDDYWNKKKMEKKAKPKSTSKSRARKSELRDDASSTGASNKRRKSSTVHKSKSAQPGGDDNDDDVDEEEKPKAKKARKVSHVNAVEDGMDLDVDDDADTQYRPMQKFKDRKSWESLVERVDTIEKVEGTLKVFFTLNNGDKVVESSQECARHFPQKLIQFYESNLRWRESE